MRATHRISILVLKPSHFLLALAQPVGSSSTAAVNVFAAPPSCLEQEMNSDLISLTDKFTLTMPETKTSNLQCAPKFLVPLKLHTAPQGYECYMSCAVTGDPTPHVTWLRDNISLNTNTNYFISNTCGVCSLLILRVGSHDMGEYKVVAETALGRVECSTKLTVRGKYSQSVLVL